VQLSWVQAVGYAPPVVLGKQLQAFSAFHVLMLDAVASPFFRGGAPDTHDLLLAVHICSSTWASRASVVTDLSSVTDWGQGQSKVDWPAEMRAFETYISESWLIPDKWETTGEREKAKANGAYHLAVFAMRFLGLPEAEAWDCPVSRLVCYRETYSEQETGKSLLKTEDELAGIEKLKAEAAATEVPNGAG
jgi:hypothetical protein